MALSIVVFYFQFFYTGQSLKVNVVDSNIEFSEKKINFTIIYHNNGKGNQHATVVNSRLICYQNKEGIIADEINIANHHLRFKEGVLNDDFQPIILSPGAQSVIIHKIPYNLNPNMFYEFSQELDSSAKVFIALESKYMNSNGLLSSKIINIGWFMLDDDYIKKHKFEYKSIDLNSNGTLVSSGRDDS